MNVVQACCCASLWFQPLGLEKGHISYKRLYLFNDYYKILKNTFVLIAWYQGLLPTCFPSSEITLCACPSPSEPVDQKEEFIQPVTLLEGI
jgi:hypothetical protein